MIRLYSPDEQARQIRQVLRLGVGDRVVALLDGAGWEAEVALVQVDKRGGNGRSPAKTPRHQRTN
ncbi:MAG: hypothetical protein M5U34_23735 [Chloroflexi bacterium]|nr:hypothetical protein [Chloroflexota bacterium]